MRARGFCAALLAAMALAGCGGDDPGSGDSSTEPDSGSAQREVRGAVRAYVSALANGDPDAACAVLTDRAKAAIGDFLPSTDRSRRCEEAARRLARRSVPLRRVTVEDVSLMGGIATARITSRRPAYESSVQLSNEEGGWKLNYPPGVVERSKAPPGVPIDE